MDNNWIKNNLKQYTMEYDISKLKFTSVVRTEVIEVISASEVNFILTEVHMTDEQKKLPPFDKMKGFVARKPTAQHHLYFIPKDEYDNFYEPLLYDFEGKAKTVPEIGRVIEQAGEIVLQRVSEFTNHNRGVIKHVDSIRGLEKSLNMNEISDIRLPVIGQVEKPNYAPESFEDGAVIGQNIIGVFNKDGVEIKPIGYDGTTNGCNTSHTIFNRKGGNESISQVSIGLGQPIERYMDIDTSKKGRLDYEQELIKARETVSMFNDTDSWLLLGEIPDGKEHEKKPFRQIRGFQIGNVGCMVDTITCYNGVFDRTQHHVLFVPNVKIVEITDENGVLIGRSIIANEN